MTSRSLQASSLSLQAPFVSGAPGPPGFRSPACAIKDEEDDDMFYAASGRGEPDDLGDLMQEMREGAPWVDGLAMECELQLGGASDPPAAFASPSASPQPPPRLDALAEEAPRRAPHPQAAQLPLQPGMAAKLMHPGAACGGGGGGALPLAPHCHMIPNPAPAMDYEGESEAPGMALSPGGAPHARCPPGGDWVPLAGAPPGSLAAFQAPPLGYYPAPAAQMGLMHGLAPPAGFDAGMAAMLAGGPPPGAFQLVPLPLPARRHAPSGSGGSGDASDTHLRLRPSLDASATNDSGSNGRGGCCPRGAAPHRYGGAARQPGAPAVPSSPFRDAPSESSDVEDPCGAGMARQLSSAQVVPDVAPAPPPAGLPQLPPWGPDAAAYAAFPPMPLPFYYEPDSPAAQTARLARQRSLERYREKKARRGFAKRIRYVARKVNADRRPRVKGRFVKAGEAAAILEAEAEAAAGAAIGSPPASDASEQADASIATVC